MAFALAMNNVKTTSTTLVVDVVNRALLICGLAGYREDGPYRMSRLLRDAHAGAVMVSNERIYTTQRPDAAGRQGGLSMTVTHENPTVSEAVSAADHSAAVHRLP